MSRILSLPMNLQNLFASLELPLLKRELIENSHRKRTYVVRILVALIFMLVMLVFYSEQIARHKSILQVMGQGRELAMLLFICNLVAIYVLLPAMACSAISAEREKQTLSLILISRITPGGLIAEKFLSRLVPMIALMLITLPMLSIAYMLGGLKLEAVFAALIGLFTAAVQVNSAAIMCSALFRTALEAFWATYLIFAVMGLGPPLLFEMGLLPRVPWFPMVGSDVLAVPFVLFLAASVESVGGVVGIWEVFLSCLPPLVVAAVMLVISRFAIAHGQQDAPLSFQAITKLSRRMSSLAFQIAAFPFRLIRSVISGTPLEFVSSSEDARPPRAFPVDRPVAWRERQISALSGWRLHVVLLCAVMVCEWGWFFIEEGRHGDEISVIFDVGFFIISLLMVVGVTCRTFSSERERQTLDLLLTTPLTNEELLKEKLSAANRTILFLMLPILFAGMTHLLIGDMPDFDHSQLSGNYYPYRTVHFFEFAWWSGATRYLFGLVTHALVYMTLVKWIATHFSLQFNSQMKAMLGTILTVLGLCIIPVMMFVIPLLLVGSDPDRADLPIWCFTSPALIFAFNETHDFYALFRSKWWPHSEYFTLFVNLFIYGTLTLIVRGFVLWRLPALLNREDSDQSGTRKLSKGERQNEKYLLSLRR